MMNKPKLPEFAVARCTVCGQEVKLGEDYETSKQKGKNGRTVYAHTRCTKGEGDDSHDTAGERTGG